MGFFVMVVGDSARGRGFQKAASLRAALYASVRDPLIHTAAVGQRY
jgi:hypothetical protein